MHSVLLLNTFKSRNYEYESLCGLSIHYCFIHVVYITNKKYLVEFIQFGACLNVNIFYNKRFIHKELIKIVKEPLWLTLSHARRLGDVAVARTLPRLTRKAIQLPIRLAENF